MSDRTIAISGASGKTGFRIAEELMAYGDRPRLLVRSSSVIPSTLMNAEQVRLSLQDPTALDSGVLNSAQTCNHSLVCLSIS